VCVAYNHRGERIEEMPADLGVLEACQPIYETLPGWDTPTAGARDFAMLPDGARRYVDRLAELCGAEIGIVSTGADRTETILRSGSAIAGWFE
jgi:adenylosuccinate synthase